MKKPQSLHLFAHSAPLSRRRFLGATAATAALLSSGPLRLFANQADVKNTSAPGKAPYRVLYGNDCTNLLSCTSPWHKRGEPLAASMFTAAVDESADAGVHAHLFQPGLCWVPWWPSKVLPADQHMRWFRKQFGQQAKAGSYLGFVLNGGDPVKLTLDRCKERGIGAFISFRLNDAHNKNGRINPDNPKTARADCTPQFYTDNPQYRFGSLIPADWPNYARFLQDWRYDEVREFKFRLIEELCVNYDLDGLELDFMRHPYFFNPDETTTDQRKTIMTQFVARVRQLLDKTARGKHRWLSVRIPAFLDTYDNIGIDLGAFEKAGVDMFNISTWYVFEQMTDAEAIRTQIQNAAVYHELTNTPYTGKTVSAQRASDNYSYRRATDAQLHTTAHLAYERGFDGISLFNFVYYREHGAKERGPFSEPPFDSLKPLHDPQWLASQPQEYFLPVTWNEPPRKNRQMGDLKLYPKILKPNTPCAFTLDLRPPQGGWQKTGLLRMQTEQILDGTLKATLNGKPLAPSAHKGELFPNPHPAQLTGPDEAAQAWDVPPGLLKKGENSVEITAHTQEEVTGVFLDLSMP